LSRSPTCELSTPPFRLANRAAFREDLLHEIIPGEGSARSAPILRTDHVGTIREQVTDLFLQCRNSFFKRHSGHRKAPALNETAWYALSRLEPGQARDAKPIKSFDAWRQQPGSQ
jgi:hypothetical protein